jgi:hypothetical protein
MPPDQTKQAHFAIAQLQTSDLQPGLSIIASRDYEAKARF